MEDKRIITEQDIAAFGAWLVREEIFVTKNGKPLDRSNIWARMKKLCEKAGVAAAKVFPHNLRKLFARCFYRLHKDIAKLADILGHASINTTSHRSAERFTLTDEELEEYESLLSVSGTGVIGYIQIDKINCYLPIYHGTDDAVLQTGVGHLEGSSLPVGGESTHCVISGHRGLPRAKLFTDLDKLEEGDTFVLYVLDEILTYEVDQIRIVEPDEIGELDIVEGEDYCTLLTCTPYGINTQRLLVRGHRVENSDNAARVTADAMQIEPVIVAPLVAVPILLLLLIGLLVRTRRKKQEP